METVRGIVKAILHRGNTATSKGLILVEYEDLESGKLSEARLSARVGSFVAGDGFVATGDWTEKEWRGQKQKILETSTLRPGFPQTKNGVLRYLTRNFLSKYGIHYEALNKLVYFAGEHAIEKIIEDPELLVSCSTDPYRYRDDINKLLTKRLSVKQATELLRAANFEDHQIEKIISMFKADAYKRLKTNPYDVMMISDIEFGQADKLASNLGVSTDDERRMTAAIWDVILRAENEGSSCVSLMRIMKVVSEKYNVEADVVKSLIVSKVKSKDNDKFYAVKLPSSPDMFALSEDNYRREISAANGIIRFLTKGRRNNPSVVNSVCDRILAGTRLDEHQKNAVRVAATEPLCVITGGPGTGKSTILEYFLKVSAEVENAKVFVSAPTAKAAKRAEEVTKSEGNTLQYLLGMQQEEDTGKTIFQRNRLNPLPDNIVVVVDEVSMMDNELLAALFQAMPNSGRIILQGDPDQLPSVGVGRVLADLLEMNHHGHRVIPVAALVNVYRQDKDSKIISDAVLIKEGVVPEVGEDVVGGVTFQECSSREITSKVIGLVRQFRKQGMDILRDVAVISPQKKGFGGVWELNDALSKELNPKGASIPGVERSWYDDKRMPVPRVGDRIMLTQNNNKDKFMNGDTGFITGHHPDPENPRRELITVRFDDGRVDKIPVGRWRDLILAYSITCHKSQGSQYPVVILPFSDNHYNTAERTLVYTAWTRAKKLVVGLGDKNVFEAYVKTHNANIRHTILRRVVEVFMEQKKIAPRGGPAEYVPLLSPDARPKRASRPEPSVLPGPRMRLKRPNTVVRPSAPVKKDAPGPGPSSLFAKKKTGGLRLSSPRSTPGGLRPQVTTPGKTADQPKKEEAEVSVAPKPGAKRLRRPSSLPSGPGPKL